jgi:glutamine amidotransferase-like uncharacterized protein
MKMALPKISGVERESYGDPVPWKDETSPLILIGTDEIEYASKTVTARRAIVRKAQATGGVLLLAWAGRYSTAVFEVDDHERALDGLASRTGMAR